MTEHNPPTGCHKCWLQGLEVASVRPVANHGYCSHHLTEFYTTLDPGVWVNGGIGIPGIPRPEYGPLAHDLTCCRCQATWTGIPGDPCWWCRRSFEIQAEMQTEVLLRPPDVDLDDPRYDDRMRAWADRLAVGVKAELITTKQAEMVWSRALKKAAA